MDNEPLISTRALDEYTISTMMPKPPKQNRKARRKAAALKRRARPRRDTLTP